MNLTANGTLTDSSVLGGRIPGLTFDASLAEDTAHVKVNGEAVGFDPGALSGKSELKGEVSGTVDVDATLRNVSNGVKPETADGTAQIVLQPSTIAGGQIQNLTVDASLAENTAHVKANGEAAGFDPGALSGKPAMNGKVGGMFDIAATIRSVSSGVTLETVDGTARIDLQPSTIGGLSIDSASVDADYHDSTGVIRTLDVKGRDLNVAATGTLALNDTGQSDLKVHADTPSLEELGKLVDQPLMGIANIDATVTGNKRDLRATGSANGSDIAYGATSALTMTTSYTVKVPDLALEQANVTADTSATFVTIGGQNINELHAKTDYNNKQVNFDATAKQPQRSLGASGSLVIHPDHQEVHLQQLGVQAQNVMWEIAPGSQPTIQYGNNAIAVERFELVSADQKITADGTFGRPGDSLNVSLTNVDLASVDALLLRPPQFSGRLNATTTVAGTTDAPEVKADFQINQGGFRQFHYDTLGGTADYSGKGIDVDAKLQQNPTTWLTAKGYVPMALFKGSVATGHREAFSPDDRIDLHIDSTPIDLAVVQGFTTALTNVTGTVQAKIDVSGSAGDPHPTGAVTVQNAAFTVEPTGVNYTDFDGKIDLQPDRVHIAEIKVLDNQKKPLTLTGDLAVHELEVGGVNLSLKASDFKVIDNKMGNVRINTDLRVAGELNQPRVEGELGLSTGVVNLDPIIAQTGESAYATQQTEYLAKTPTNGQAEAPKPSIYEALYVDVHVTVPNDLVIKAQELQTSGAPIGLGSLNLTLGGDLYASKVPYDQLRLTGTVNTVRGTYTFQGRRFEILRDGTVRFDGLDELDPALDVRTERVIQAVTATVAVRGTVSKPEIVLSSVPPLEEADILALIVFNQPLNQLGEGQQISVAQRAQGLATGAAASQLAQSIGKALNLDTFEINTAPDSGGAAQFTIGQQLGQNVYVKLEQGVGDQSTTNFVFEYELARWLRLRTNVLQGSSTQQQLFQRMQGSGADLLFFFSY
jgi:autotransporter translocation and assembly factor TamB